MGYYFEVTKSNISLVPEYFMRKQTLKNAERYFTEELKSMELKILGSEEKSLQLEYEIFIKIRDRIKDEINRIQGTSRIISILDVLVSFARVARSNNYTRPSLNKDGYIKIVNGRHPVVENTIENNLFVANDTTMDKGENMIHIITGPNMAGKSTYMRQVALITLLAQVGSFVPADKADISIVDRIFTRIGAWITWLRRANFYGEMNEVANIIRHATEDSLIILDEVGRGDQYLRWFEIAWSIIEYITLISGPRPCLQPTTMN